MSMGESNTVVSAYTMYKHLQQYCSHHRCNNILHMSIGESNTVISAYTMYRYLQLYCSHPSML